MLCSFYSLFPGLWDCLLLYYTFFLQCAKDITQPKVTMKVHHISVLAWKLFTPNLIRLMHELNDFYYKEKMKDGDLRGNPEFEKQRAHNKTTTKSKKPSYYTSKNTASTIKHELVDPKISALFSFRWNHSPTLVQADCLIQRYRNWNR